MLSDHAKAFLRKHADESLLAQLSVQAEVFLKKCAGKFNIAALEEGSELEAFYMFHMAATEQEWGRNWERFPQNTVHFHVTRV